MPHNPTVSVVVPTRDEAANLTLLLPQLPADYEVVLVDGRSRDRTVAVARALRPDAVVVRQTRRGKGNALACGFLAATGDVVVTLDADCSADPAEIPRLVAELVVGADVARGTRFAAGGGSEQLSTPERWQHRAVTALANALLGRTLAHGRRATDLGSGYLACWRDLVRVLDLPDATRRAPANRMFRGDGVEVDALIGYRFAAAGARVVEVPVLERPRAFGCSHRRPLADGLRVLRTVLAEAWRARRRTSRPEGPHAGHRSRESLTV